MLYLIIVIMFGVRLDYLDGSTPDQCYSTSRVAVRHGLHPMRDQIYLRIISHIILPCFLQRQSRVEPQISIAFGLWNLA